MRTGQVVNGYRITTAPTNTNAGKCVWAFAERDDRQYFVKEFIEIRRPRPGSMGSPELKRQLEAVCAEFEQRHRSVMDRIDPTDLQAGNLVLAHDFFWHGSRCYKVSERLDHDDTVAPHLLDPAAQQVLLGTLLDSLELLHRLGVVHGDVKPTNVLLHRPATSAFHVGKLIDFDDAYLSGRPPARETVGGDPLFCSPEFLHYTSGAHRADPATMTTSSDLFSLGLLLHLYLTGGLPRIPDGHDVPAAAVAHGAVPGLAPSLPTPTADLIGRLLAADRHDRPGVTEVRGVLERPATPAPPATTVRPASRSRIRSTFGPAPTTPPTTSRPGSRVRINLTGRDHTRPTDDHQE